MLEGTVLHLLILDHQLLYLAVHLLENHLVLLDHNLQVLLVVLLLLNLLQRFIVVNLGDARNWFVSERKGHWHRG